MGIITNIWALSFDLRYDFWILKVGFRFRCIEVWYHYLEHLEAKKQQMNKIWNNYIDLQLGVFNWIIKLLQYWNNARSTQSQIVPVPTVDKRCYLVKTNNSLSQNATLMHIFRHKITKYESVCVLEINFSRLFLQVSCTCILSPKEEILKRFNIV